jgi:hypothetical protein
VLVSLRQPTISTTPVTDPYQLLVLEFFNQVKQEVEDATNWRALYQTGNVTIPNGGYYGTITGTNERSRVVRAPIKGAGMSQAGYMPSLMAADNIVALVFDVTSPSTQGQFPLLEIPLHQLLYRFTNSNGTLTQMQTPEFFAMGAGNTDNSLLGQNKQVLYVYPVVNNTRSVQVTVCTPQSDFNTNLQDSNGSSNILVPSYPILMGLQWMCREERGEELSASGAYSESKYREVLDDAVSLEESEKGNELDLMLL